MRALVRVATARKKEKKEKEKGKEVASLSTLKVVGKGAPKCKVDKKEDRPPKKGKVAPSADKQLKKPSFPKQGHGVGKGLMMSTSPVSEETRRLLTHKDYTDEMVESIIKEMDLDPCGNQETKDLASSGLFNLYRVCLFPLTHTPYDSLFLS